MRFLYWASPTCQRVATHQNSRTSCGGEGGETRAGKFICFLLGLSCTSRHWLAAVQVAAGRLTGSGGLTHERDELLLDLLHRVQVVYKEDVAVAGLAGDVHQLTVVGVRKADGKDDVAWGKKKPNIQDISYINIHMYTFSPASSRKDGAEEQRR